MRSNSSSQAVSAVSGSAAASANRSVAGMRPTMRSSTRWYSLLVPGRICGRRNRPVAGLEERAVRADRLDDAGGVETEDSGACPPDRRRRAP